MNKKILSLFLFLLVGSLLPSCSYDDYEDLYESTSEHKDGKVVLRFIMPFIVDKIHSGEMADMWHELRFISLDKSDLMKVRTKFLRKGDNKTSVEMEFPEGKTDINGKYVLCLTFNHKADSANTTRTGEEEGGTKRYVIEIDDNSVTSVSKASSMTGFAYGDGSEENPYQICGADDFYMLDSGVFGILSGSFCI